MSAAAGSAAAAAVGARNGRELGQKMVQQQRIARKSMVDQIHMQQKKMVDTIMATYDLDHGGTLSKKELAPMLNEYSLQVEGSETKPSPEDIDFLIVLITKGEAGNEIDKEEVLAVCEAWGKFLKQKAYIRELLAQSDANKDFSIDKQELQPLLDSLNNGTAVPPEVTSWVMEQADITKTGALSEMEVVRAVYAFERWNGTRDKRNLDDDHIMVGIESDPNLPPPPKKKSCCILL